MPRTEAYDGPPWPKQPTPPLWLPRGLTASLGKSPRRPRRKRVRKKGGSEDISLPPAFRPAAENPYTQPQPPPKDPKFAPRPPSNGNGTHCLPWEQRPRRPGHLERFPDVDEVPRPRTVTPGAANQAFATEYQGKVDQELQGLQDPPSITAMRGARELKSAWGEKM